MGFSRKAGLAAAVSAGAMILALGTGDLSAYESYHDPNTQDQGYCSNCHPGFLGRGPLHALHNDWFVDQCDLCHTGSGRDNPFTVWSASTNPRGYGCAGCHGRDYGETISRDWRGFLMQGLPKMSGYGLRRRHAANGVDICATCHLDVEPCVLTENVQPIYYTAPYFGAGLTFVDDPCNANGFEDGTGDAQGLDNDGDTLYDQADPDCTGCVDADGDGWGAGGGAACPSGPEPDCEDCIAAVNPGGPEEDDPTLCSDGLDNDCDGGADDQDPDGLCGSDPCGDGACDFAGGENPCNCPADCPLPGVETGACDNGCDDDADGCTDRSDSDCGGTEDCATAGDQDCDGLGDATDPDCSGCGDGTCDTAGGEDPCTCAADCPMPPDETNACDNLCDDDGDGCTDSIDSDCGGTENCAMAGDQDCDGLDDTSDPDCGGCGDGACDPAGGEDPCTCAVDCPVTADEASACGNSCDDDGDGCTDGSDSDCGGTEDCATAGDQDCDGLDDASDPDCGAADADGDGVLDSGDDCPRDWDPLQQDGDGDGLGDACDPDDEVIPLIVGVVSQGADLELRWEKTPPDPRPEYTAYAVYRGDLTALSLGTPSVPNYTHVFQACAVAPDRFHVQAGIRDAADYYFLVAGWDMEPGGGGMWEGPYGWSDIPPLGGAPDAGDMQRERSQPPPACP